MRTGMIVVLEPRLTRSPSVVLRPVDRRSPDGTVTMACGVERTIGIPCAQATGVNPDSNLVEIVELKDHPWFLGVQFHPELKSTVENPHPLFVSFVKACMEKHP